MTDNIVDLFEKPSDLSEVPTGKKSLIYNIIRILSESSYDIIYDYICTSDIIIYS